MVATPDELAPLYRTIRVLGALGVLILVAGFVELLAFEPLGQHTGTRLNITGVVTFDPRTGTAGSSPRTHFGPDETFAAVVDWPALPPDMVVSARWYNSLQEQVGGVGPEPAGSLAARRALVVEHNSSDLKHNLPGHYTLVVLRYANGQPVEVIARRTVLVGTGG